MNSKRIILFHIICFLLPSILGAQSPTGNRVIPGSSNLPDHKKLEFVLSDTPVRIAGYPTESGSVWYVVTKNGDAIGLEERGGMLSNRETFHQLPDDDTFRLDENGFLTHKGQKVFPQPFLPDAKILTDDDGRILILSDPTSRYRHGILGDTLEAGSYRILNTDRFHQTGELREETYVRLEDDAVFETLAPIWYDVDNDGRREVIITQSKTGEGARIAVYSWEGKLIAKSEPIGRSFRWLHLFAAGDFGPGRISAPTGTADSSEPGPSSKQTDGFEIAVVRTPHIGGVLEFYRIKGRRLEKVASARGYSTHIIGSRNLDMVLTSDFNGDGILDILLPDSSFTRLDNLQRNIGGIEINFSLSLTARLTTNIEGFSGKSGRQYIGYGSGDGIVTILVPPAPAVEVPSQQ